MCDIKIYIEQIVKRMHTINWDLPAQQKLTLAITFMSCTLHYCTVSGSLAEVGLPRNNDNAEQPHSA